jgi:predicted dehydrogenase
MAGWQRGALGSAIVIVSLCGWAQSEEPLQKLGRPSAGETKVLAPIGSIPARQDWVHSLAFSPDGGTLAVGLKDDVELFDVGSRTLRGKLSGKRGRVRALAFSPDGSLLAIGGYQSLQVWHVPSAALVREFPGHRGSVTGVAFSPDGERLASAADDETARIWPVEEGPAVMLAGHQYPVQALAWSSDGKWLATASGDELRPTKAGEVRLWGADGTFQRVWSDHSRAALTVAFTPDGQHIVSGGMDEVVLIHHREREALVARFEGHGRPVNALVVHPRGRAVLSVGGGRATGENKLLVWDANHLKELGVGDAHTAKPLAVAVTADGRLAATGGQDRLVWLWDLSFLGHEPAPAGTTAAAPTVDSAPLAGDAAVSAAAAAGAAAAASAATAADRADERLIRVGVIGLDTSHAPAFAKLMNDPKDDASLAGCRVVAAYPPGSPDIKSSTERVPAYTEEYRKMGIEIVDSIPALLEKVDCVLLESNDGRPHLEQVLPVLRAGKPCFIDKPIAGSLTDAVLIFEASRHYRTPVFSSSSLRYVAGAQDARSGKFGHIVGCDAFSPASLEPTHPDLFWYGIHGVELLFTTMGVGCETVVRIHTPGTDVVVGTWKGGRVGTFRGIREGKGGYGGRAFGSKENADLGTYAGYKPLVVDIVKFFKSKEPPVAEEETLEIYAFMEAADESKRRGGVPVSVREVLDAARKAAAERRPTILK